ncbi:MAG: hypothetical protein H0U85_08620 [Gemmatimonadales bacterium]|nr:hypothetical protein [Gemmatimonadales bacterium]
MRITTLLMLIVVGAALVLGGSWALASYRIADLLGGPPPHMGESKTTFEYQGSPALKGHPRAWNFSYGPTVIPGAPRVRIYVDLTGHILRMEPSDLPELLKAFHATGT